MEIWKAIPSSPAYEVSNLGRVRHGDRLLHIRKRKTGYLLTTLGIKRSTAYIHHLVAEAFIGPRPPGFEIDHLDFDKSNNRPENLEYVSHRENQRRAIAKGVIKPPVARARGESQWCSKLTTEQVKTIRALATSSIHKTVIAKNFGISVGQVFRIISRKKWAHV